MVKTLKFTIEDKTIAELFGRQSFTSKESAVFELVKNAYDSGSKICDIGIYQDSSRSQIFVKDEGCGMDSHDIERNWMHVGRSTKGYKDESISERVLAGSKGIGRFALARLGNDVEMVTSKNGNCILWKTDWDNSTLVSSDGGCKGTNIIINDLRDKWNKSDVKKLQDFLCRAYLGNSMEINLVYNDEPFDVAPLFTDLKMGSHFVQKIELTYKSKDKKLFCEIKSDEFKNEAAEIATDVDIHKKKLEIDLLPQFGAKVKENIYNEEHFVTLGDFNAELYFSLDRVTKDFKEKFLYKHDSLSDRINCGIILYRNEISISSLEGKKDWIKLNARSRKSPAAASHPSGNWRVRSNQISGFVEIDKMRNENLVDLANRQGLNENIYYDLFTDIIELGISEFERYRQSIIRKIVKNEKQDIKPKTTMLDEFLNKMDSVKEMSEDQLKELAEEIDAIKEDSTKAKDAVKVYAEQVKYDVRILNLLATQGLKANAIAHELHNDRNKISVGFRNVISSLKKFGYWDELNTIEKTQYSFSNVPLILSDLDRITNKLGVFLDTILRQIRKSEFVEKINSLEDTFHNIRDRWRNDYKYLSIQIDMNSSENNEFSITPDVINVILDNLILNSIQNNPLVDELGIKISTSVEFGVLKIVYSDNGIGLDEKYSIDPYRILEVHETSRIDGHGLGMWIINNTLQIYGGHISNISSDNGFTIAFEMKGDNNE